MRKLKACFCFWKHRSYWKNPRNTSAQGYYKAQRSMRKWWSSGICFMPHPTTLGACRDGSRQLLNSMTNSIVCIPCVIKGAKNMFHISTEYMTWQPIGSSLVLLSHSLNAVTVSPVLFPFHLQHVMIMTRWNLEVIHTHQQFTSGYNKLFFNSCVVGCVWCPNSDDKSEH